MTCPTCPTCPRAIRALRALRAQVYFSDWKIKKWKFCNHTFLRVLRLSLDNNFLKL